MNVAESVFKRARTELATEAGAPDPYRRQYTRIAIGTVVAASAAGWLFELYTPVIIAGLTAMFALVATSGHSLRADLRRFARFVPILVLVMVLGPLLSQLPVLAAALVAVAVFSAGMLPALGDSYRVFGETFAAVALVSTSTAIGWGQPVSVLLAATVLGALFALTLRVMLGRGDPTRAMRATVALALTERGPGVIERAAAAWRAENGIRWLGQVLAGTARFRAARETLLAQAEHYGPAEAERIREIVAEADRVAAELAKAVRSRSCTGLPPLARKDPLRVADIAEPELPQVADSLNDGLDQIRHAVINRETTTLRRPRLRRRCLRALGSVRAHLSPRSSLFRHALRCTMAVIAGMTLVLLIDDKSASTLLLSLYLVLQPAARDSMTGALERTAAVVLVVTALVTLNIVLPGAVFLIPVALIVMLLRTQWLRDDYRKLLWALLAITVVHGGMTTGPWSPVNTAISYTANAAIGGAIALFIGYIGYLVLPASSAPDVRGTVRATVWALRELVRGTEAASRGAAVKLQSAHVLAQRRTQDLLGMPALLDGTGTVAGDAQAMRAVAVSLDAVRQDVAALALRPEPERVLAVPALRMVDALLGDSALFAKSLGGAQWLGDAQPPAPAHVPKRGIPATELLASSMVENALHARAAIDVVCRNDTRRTSHLRAANDDVLAQWSRHRSAGA